MSEKLLIKSLSEHKHSHTRCLHPPRIIPHSSFLQPAPVPQSLGPVAVVTLPPYTMARRLRNVFSAGAVCGPHYRRVGREHSTPASHTRLRANEKPGLTGSFHADTSEPAAAAEALSFDSSGIELQRCCSYSLISCVSAETQLPVETEPE